MMPPSGAELHLFPLFAGLFGGLALFLFGLGQLSDGLKAVAGNRMKSVLQKLTSNRFMGVLTGALVTAVIQSSSVTTVLVVGFISAGVMNLTQAVGIIMGANIGTTITAQIVALDVHEIALPFIALGFLLQFIKKNESWRHYGGILMGLGLIFFGMNLMGDAMRPLRTFPPFLDIMLQMQNPFLGILAGAAFTALVQSSSATAGIVVVMAGQGLISLEAGIALVFGSNIGTCVTAMLASLGKPREAIRASLVHVIFNIIGVLLWIAFIPELAHWVRTISPVAEAGSGIQGLAAVLPRQVANAHTLFNVINTVVMIGFAGILARIVTRLVPDRPEPESEKVAQPKYLDLSLIDTPSVALASVRNEIGHLGARVDDMLNKAMPVALQGSLDDLDNIRRMDAHVDALHRAILDYVRQIGLKRLNNQDTRSMMAMMEMVNALENAGDVIETDIIDVGLDRITGGLQVSPATADMLLSLSTRTTEAMALAVKAVVEEDVALARQVVDMKPGIQALGDAASAHGAQRLVTDGPHRAHLYAKEMELVEKMRRLYYFAKRIAKAEIDLQTGTATEPVRDIDGAVPENAG